MRLRTGTVADAAPLARLHTAAWQAGYRGLLPDAYLDGLVVGERARRWVNAFTAPQVPFSMLLAEEDARLLGFVAFGPSRDAHAPRGTAEVSGLYVDPAAWRHGIGSALLSAATEQLRADGFREATLWVLEGNTAARGCYESAGWTAEDTMSPAEFGGVTVTKRRYRRRLHDPP